jgi:hypothetical protein
MVTFQNVNSELPQINSTSQKNGLQQISLAEAAGKS